MATSSTMMMCLRKRRPPKAPDQPLFKHPKSVSDSTSDEEQIFEPTIFDNLIPDCMDELLDWLPFASLCSLSKTCKSLQIICRNFFLKNFPSQEFTIGDEFVFNEQHWKCFGDIVPHLCLYDSTLDDFAYAGSNVNRNLREIEFLRTFKQENQITHMHIDKIQNLLENVKTIGAVNCEFADKNTAYLLSKCKKIESLAFSVSKHPVKSQISLRPYPTLRNLEIHFDSKANVLEAFECIIEENPHLDELVLSFQKEHERFMAEVFDELDAMYTRGIYKRLYLMFDKKSMVAEHINRLTTMQGLFGLSCSYTISIIDDHMADIAKLQNLRFLNINWILDCADEIAKELQQLIELDVSVITIGAIRSFVRFSGNLVTFHIEQIRAFEEFKTKFDAVALDAERNKLDYARKLMIYIPEKKFMQLKWSSVNVDSRLVKFKREESMPPKREDDTANDNN